MRPDRDATSGMVTKVVPVHRRELTGIVAGKLGKREGSAYARVPSTDENLDGHAQPLERREDRRCASKRVIEGHVHLVEAGQRANLPQQEVGLDAEPVLPGRRDSVVTEDERGHAGGPAGRTTRP